MTPLELNSILTLMSTSPIASMALKFHTPLDRAPNTAKRTRVCLHPAPPATGSCPWRTAGSYTEKGTGQGRETGSPPRPGTTLATPANTFTFSGFRISHS